MAEFDTMRRVRSPFVGRDQDMALLQARLAQAVRGQGQVVGIAGEPGIGKSRLLAEFRLYLTGQPVQYYEGHCVAYGQATPYLPVLDILHQCCGITVADPADVGADRRNARGKAFDQRDGRPFVARRQQEHIGGGIDRRQVAAPSNEPRSLFDAKRPGRTFSM